MAAITHASEPAMICMNNEPRTAEDVEMTLAGTILYYTVLLV